MRYYCVGFFFKRTSRRLYKPDSEEVQTESKAIEQAPENKAVTAPPQVKRAPRLVKKK